ncbi:unnamed protein product [marine sediment metagenome]|uniref:Uncharacterized protein n=1 Tax=marine sediment metagenome TaxID=412755 RepID=X1RCS2_9ZZZZ
MERGDVKEAIEHLDKTDEVIKHRIRMRQVSGEQHALEEARELVQKAVTKLLPFYVAGG